MTQLPENEPRDYQITYTQKNGIHFIALAGNCDIHCADAISDILDMIFENHPLGEKVVFIANEIVFCEKYILGLIFKASAMLRDFGGASVIAPENNVLRTKLFFAGIGGHVGIYDTLEQFHQQN